MKANELMIGDWVKTPVDMGKIQAINATCLPNFQTVEVWHKRYEDGRRAGDYICDPLDLQPIPLTPEILEKNGWKHKYYGIYRQMIGEAITIDIFPEGCSVVDERGSQCRYRLRYHLPAPKFVHELQHALRLCGIEKEIEL